jgi:hypothetical protein
MKRDRYLLVYQCRLCGKRQHQPVWVEYPRIQGASSINSAVLLGLPVEYDYSVEYPRRRWFQFWKPKTRVVRKPIVFPRQKLCQCSCMTNEVHRHNNPHLYQKHQQPVSGVAEYCGATLAKDSRLDEIVYIPVNEGPAGAEGPTGPPGPAGPMGPEGKCRCKRKS